MFFCDDLLQEDVNILKLPNNDCVIGDALRLEAALREAAECGLTEQEMLAAKAGFSSQEISICLHLGTGSITKSVNRQFDHFVFQICILPRMLCS